MPCKDCASSLPSPVITRSAASMRWANSSASDTTSTPGRTSRTQERHQAEPQPTGRTCSRFVAQSTPRSRYTIADRCASADRGATHPRSTHPSGARRRRSPRAGPVRGLSTSLAAEQLSAPRRGSRPVLSIRASSNSAAPPGSQLPLRRHRAGARRAPAPCPPRHRSSRCRPGRRSAGRRAVERRADQLAGSRVVVTRGSRRAGERSSSPDADAISTIADAAARRSARPNAASIRSSRGPVHGGADHFALAGRRRVRPWSPRRHRPWAPGPARRPGASAATGRHRLGGLTRRERATELVGSHQDAHPADATIPRRT